MSKKTKSAKASFTYTLQHDIPTLTDYPTEWDMTGHYYNSLEDPQLEVDIAYTESVYKKFAKKYRSSDFTENPVTLAKALSELNNIDENSRIGKPTRYMSLLSALDSTNTQVTNKLSLYSQRLTKAANELLFFSIALANVDTATQKMLLAAPELEAYTYSLSSLFKNAKHQLSESEEKIIRLYGDVSYGMWVEMTERMLGSRFVTYKKESIPVNSAFDRVTTLPFKEQPKLWGAIMDEISPLGEIVEHELTAVATRKKISDELRGYKTPYSAAVIEHEDDEKSVQALVEAVSTTGFSLSQQFYKLKAKLHGEKQIAYAQRGANIGNIPFIPFDQATDICRDVFYGLNPIYGEIFDRLLTNGHIDVYPKPGKRGGAFCAGDTGQPTNILLNQVDSLRSLETYAHEMGHAIHTERSKTQPAHYQQYSTTTAETASTLFEGLLFDAILEQATPDQQAVLLHDKIAGDIATIQRQIAFHNFELDLHETVRAQGGITKEELNTKMQHHLRAYCGPGIDVTEQDGHSYIYIGHFRYGFYVYTYTFGILMSSIMTRRYHADASYSAHIDQFLTAGGSADVSTIFKGIGINTKKIETFTESLETQAAEIARLKKLTK